MKLDIIINFAIAVVIVGIISVMMYKFHGLSGFAAYILFVGLCLTPASPKARSILKGEKGGSK